MHLLVNQAESVTRVPSIERILRSLHHLRERGGKDRGTDFPDGADHDSREHRSHQRITGNATITGTMGSGVPALRDISEDTFSKTLKCHASNGEIFMVSFKRDSISLTSYDAGSIRTTLETWAGGIPALINTRFSCIIRGPDTPVRSPGSSYSEHHLVKDTGIGGSKGPI